jgi:hypothetical protein
MAIGDFLRNMRDIFNDVVDNIKMLIETKFLPTIEKIFEIFKMIFDAVVPIFLDFVEFIKNQLDIILKFWNENGKQIMEAVINIFNFIVGFLFFIMNKFLDIVKFFLPFITGLFEVAFIFIKRTFENGLKIVMGIFKIFAGVFTGDWKKVWEGVKDVFSGIFSQVANIFKTVINSILNQINFVTGKISNIKINIPKVNIPLIGEVGGGSIGMPAIPKIPLLADGGIINKPTLAMIGEGGESEAVIPLSKLAGLSGNNQTHIYLDGREITRSIAPKMVDMIRAKGVMA